MKVLVLGDGAALTTGFAQVIQRCVAEFNRRGWDVSQITSLDGGKNFDPERYHRLGITPYAPEYENGIGFELMPIVQEREQSFDVIFLNCDPGMAFNWMNELDKYFPSVPTVGYFPIEGAPVCSAYGDSFRRVQYPVTYTAWSATQLKLYYDLDVPFIYHGVDTNVWKPLESFRRKQLRKQLGWDGKFVVAYVARNAGRKGHDRLIKAVRLLKDGGPNIPAADDYLLYLHCSPFEEHALQGWDLSFFVHVNGVADRVQFPDQHNAIRGIERTTLAERLAAADLYVHAAKVEGFGLPIIEAMACGLPVVIPADGGNMEEVVGDAALARIKPSDWDTWFNGVQLCCVDPANFARVIHSARHNRQMRETASHRSLGRAQVFSWDVMAGFLANQVAQAASQPLEPIPGATYSGLPKLVTVSG